MKSKIKGSVECKNENEIEECKKILNRFNIGHIIEDNIIKIDGFVKATCVFDKDGFERMLRGKLSRIARTNITVGAL